MSPVACCGGSGGGADALLVVEVLLVVGDRNHIGLHGALLAGHLAVLLARAACGRTSSRCPSPGNPSAGDRDPSGFPRDRARHAPPCRRSP